MMNLFPKDSTFEAEENILDDLPTIGSGELEMFLKQEHFQSDCLHSGFSGTVPLNPNFIPEEVNFVSKSPDSTIPNTIPCPTSRLPAKEDFRGQYDFHIVLKNIVGDRKKWEFSEQLNKIFATMHCKVPIKFKWSPKVSGLYVRALPVFLSEDSFEEPVRRCAGHSSHREKSNEGFKHVDHVIRCDHPYTVYDWNPDSLRFSVVVPLDPPQPGADGTTVVYSFVCKNSCPVGINRRSTAVIFTLESTNGEVVGRKFLRMRICSCPHRDKTKEENEEKKIVSNNDAQCVQSIKKQLKRLNKKPGVVNFSIRLPSTSVKSIATIVREVFVHGSLNENREMTPNECIAVEDCNKYI